MEEAKPATEKEVREKPPLLFLTGLWQNATKDGRVYLSGQVAKQLRVVVFENTKKAKPQDPDWTMYLSGG